MKKKSRILFLLIFFSNLFLCNPINGTGLKVSTSVTEIDKMAENQVEEGYGEGISGAVAGKLGEMWVVAGGCNFPVNPLESCSEKKYYQGIYVIDHECENPITTGRIGALPEALAYGGAVNYGESLVIVGGSNAVTSFPDVFELYVDACGNIMTEKLPSLPNPVDNFGLTISGSRIYLAGGNVGGVPSNDLFVLDMENPQKEWHKLQPFPGNPRVQPVLEASKDKQGHECVYLWGGFAGKGQGRNATLDTDGYKYDIESGQWSLLASPLNSDKEEVSLGGATSATLKDGRIIVAGGVNKDIFLAALQKQPVDYLHHPAEWYNFNKRLLIFDPVTEEWEDVGENHRFARAGACLLISDNDELILVGGELKPRIRTTDICKIKLDL